MRKWKNQEMSIYAACAGSSVMMMKIKIIFLLLVILIAAGCKKADSASAADSLIEQARQAAKDAVQGIAPNESESPQIVIPAQQQQPSQSFSQNDVSPEIISRNYAASCMLERYKVLNSYCKGKTFWVKQATLISWYVPYAVVLLVLAIALFLLWLWRRNH